VAPLAAAGPVAVLFAGVRRRAALHIDQPDLPRLAPVVVLEQFGERLLRLYSLGEQIQSARSVLDHRRRLRAHRADAGAHVGHGAADERHARRHRGAGLSGRRIDRAQRKGRVLREPFVVQRDAVGCALLTGERRHHDGEGDDKDRAKSTCTHGADDSIRAFARLKPRAPSHEWNARLQLKNGARA
jgi:hypothetical protein